MKTGPVTVLHIPHSSREIPADIRRSLVLSDSELESELLRLTDSYTDVLYDCGQAAKVVFPVSRLVVDPERFLDDSEEPMSKFGMGVVYTKTSTGRPLRRSLTDRDREALIEQYYNPHHRELTAAVSSSLSGHGRCLIIDGHSFPSKAFRYETDLSPRPDICLGTDSYHTPAWLKDLAGELFRNAGFAVKIDSPFPGSMVPLTYYHTHGAVYSIMIEVNRALYMDEKSGRRTAKFEQTKNRLKGVLVELIDRVSGM
ncbi:MAG: N-formylglutamate amidohydrolase [Dehalococcoidales bacterium]|nr:N-formylglutamate amidohydrolase [Dehalococcoidales bacterium]